MKVEMEEKGEKNRNQNSYCTGNEHLDNPHASHSSIQFDGTSHAHIVCCSMSQSVPAADETCAEKWSLYQNNSQKMYISTLIYTIII